MLWSQTQLFLLQARGTTSSYLDYYTSRCRRDFSTSVTPSTAICIPLQQRMLAASVSLSGCVPQHPLLRRHWKFRMRRAWAAKHGRESGDADGPHSSTARVVPEHRTQASAFIGNQKGRRYGASAKMGSSA